LSRSTPNKHSQTASATVWLADARSVRDEDVNPFIERLGDSEKRRLAGFVRPARKRQFILGRVLLRLALARELGLSPADIDVVERPGNSPQVVLNDSAGVRPGYSLSHSADWVACVVSRDTIVGLDIEAINTTRDVMALGHAAFTADECTWLQQQPHEWQIPAFYYLWSLKEALYKMQGTAQTGSLPSLVDSSGVLISEGQGWYSYPMAHPGLSFVVCSARPLSTVHLVEPTELILGDK
jgi:4'-phosphopantetheinyl transferase